MNDDKSAAATAVADARPWRFNPNASVVESVSSLRRYVESGALSSMEPLLPLLFNLKNRPYTINEHIVFSPLFRFKSPRQLTLMCARQVSKSTSGASRGLLFSACIPHFTTLYVTPLFEQIRKFSVNYVKPFIADSPIRDVLSDETTENSVLQRSLRNKSRLMFTYAFDNASRARGISCDAIKIDECQDTDLDTLMIIFQASSFSEWDIHWTMGTPKTMDNTLTGFWDMSSQAEWFTRCRTGGCNKWNIASTQYDLLKMIGPMRPDIAADNPAVVCGGCCKPLDVKTGRWVHRRPDVRWSHAGYHVPKILLPHHYGSPTRWSRLLADQQNMDTPSFLNEVLGEPCDTGSRLVSRTDLQNAAILPWENTWRDVGNDPDADGEAMLKTAGGCVVRALGIDWGGGGKSRTSYTKLSLVGWTPDGVFRILWGKKLLTPHEPGVEADEIVRWINRFDPHFIAHDYTGAGLMREHILIESGVPIARNMPMQYVHSCGRFPVRYVPASDVNPRPYWQMAKSRVLQMICLMIQQLKVVSFKWDNHGVESPGLLSDFLSLIDEKTETSVGGYYVIKCAANQSDDFAQATAMAIASICHVQDAWPSFIHALRTSITSQQLMVARGGDVANPWVGDVDE